MHAAMVGALPIVISGDLLRPSLTWLVGGGQRTSLSHVLAASRDPEGFAKVRAYCERNGRVSHAVATQMAYRCAQLLSAKGGTVAEIVFGDVIELFATEAILHRSKKDGRVAYYQMLRELAILGAEAPTTLPLGGSAPAASARSTDSICSGAGGQPGTV